MITAKDLKTFLRNRNTEARHEIKDAWIERQTRHYFSTAHPNNYLEKLLSIWRNDYSTNFLWIGHYATIAKHAIGIKRTSKSRVYVEFAVEKPYPEIYQGYHDGRYEGHFSHSIWRSAKSETHDYYIARFDFDNSKGKEAFDWLRNNLPEKLRAKLTAMFLLNKLSVGQ